eukprot:gene10139-2558_t
MQYTFNIVDPSKKKVKKKKNWVTNLPEEQQTKFQQFTLDQFVETTVKKNREKVDSVLKNTCYTYDSLEKKYSNDTKFHQIFDLKGVTLWYNQSFMELTNRTTDDYLKINLVDMFIQLNPDHPFTHFLVNMLQTRPKHARIDSSEVILVNMRKFKFRATYERIDNEEGPLAYLVHLEQTM